MFFALVLFYFFVKIVVNIGLDLIPSEKFPLSVAHPLLSPFKIPKDMRASFMKSFPQIPPQIPPQIQI